MINNPDDFRDLLEEVFINNKETESVIIKKTMAGSCGTNIFKLYGNQVRSDESLVNQIYNNVIISGFIFQETIKQHSDLERLNPSCLNTIRIDTFIDNENRSEVISAYLRMSISNQFIDNISSGGCQVGININTGQLKKYGYAPVKIIGASVLEEHPVTKVKFEDFEIPFFDRVKDLDII